MEPVAALVADALMHETAHVGSWVSWVSCETWPVSVPRTPVRVPVRPLVRPPVRPLVSPPVRPLVSPPVRPVPMDSGLAETAAAEARTTRENFILMVVVVVF